MKPGKKGAPTGKRMVTQGGGTWLHRLLPRVDRGVHDQRGVVGIEAAILLPIMIFFIFATMEIYQYYRAYAVMERAAFTIADALSIQDELQDRKPCDVPSHLCTYGRVIKPLMEPIDYEQGGHLVIRLFKAETKTHPGSGTSHPAWTLAWGKKCTGSGDCSDYDNTTQPPEMPEATDTDTIIVVQVFQDYTPFAVSSVFWSALKNGHTTLSVAAFYRPRFSDLLNPG